MGKLFNKEDSPSLGSHLWLFIKRFSVTGFFYCLVGSAFYLIPFFLCLGLKKLGISHEASMTVLRILLTIAPLVPTWACAHIAAEDAYGEVSMDLCFAAWIVTIIWAWWLL